MKKNQQKVIKERKIFYKIFGRFQSLNIPFRTMQFFYGSGKMMLIRPESQTLVKMPLQLGRQSGGGGTIPSWTHLSC